jgi:A/G-specific adenine glycosylase
LEILAWYDAKARTLPWRLPPGTPIPADPDWPYRVWLSEVMLQQTTVAAATRYFLHFSERWPNIAALAAAPDAEVMAAWAGLGYYARARNLLACARAVVRDHGGRFPDEEAALQRLPGIGDYTAAAIAAIAFGRESAPVDANVERVGARLFAIDTPLPGGRKAIAAAARTLYPAGRCGDFAQALMDLGSRICTPRSPDCGACPAAASCRGRASGDPAAFPVRAAKRSRPIRHGIAWWIERDDQVLLVRRPQRGLLGGMAALPCSDWHAELRAAPPFAAAWRDCGTVSHAFTHFELRLGVRAARLPAGEIAPVSGEAWWVPIDSATDGLPTLFARTAALALATRSALPDAA